MSFILPEGTLIRRSSVPLMWERWGLGPRLASLAKGVSQGAKVVDIGTDHGQLPEVLVRASWVARARGIDRAPDALRAAQNRLEQVGWPGKAMELCLGEGLASVEADIFDCAVLAGFGSRKMIEILERDPPESLGIQRLILQPTAGLPALRSYVCGRGWRIIDEQIVCEGRRGFITSVVSWDGGATSLTPFDALLGNVALDEPLLVAWMYVQLQHLIRQGERASGLRKQVETWLSYRQFRINNESPETISS